MRELRTALLLALTLPGCGAPTPVHIASGCERLDLDEGSCLLPWPSGQFLVDDPSTDTGRRISLPADEMPMSFEMNTVSPAPWNARDGFSAMTSMVVRIEGQIDDAVLHSWRHTDLSLAEGSPTVLLDVTHLDAPVRVAHFAEIEPPDPMTPQTFTTLYVRPAARLEENHHYVVAVRGLIRAGARPRSSVTFAALRDSRLTDSAAAEARRSHFEQQVFAPLDRAGVVRDQLIVAWDFWTGTGPIQELLAMRDLAFAHVDDLHCMITDPNATSPDPEVRAVEGLFEVPYFLDANCATGQRLSDLQTTGLSRDAAGAPTQHGTCLARFEALIPRSVSAAAPRSVPLIEYGHGLGNSIHEIAEPGVVTPVLQATGSIGITTDALGLSEAGTDTLAIVDGLRDLSQFSAVDARVMQGVIAQVVLPHVFAHACAALPELGVDSVVDASRRDRSAKPG